MRDIAIERQNGGFHIHIEELSGPPDTPEESDSEGAGPCFRCCEPRADFALLGIGRQILQRQSSEGWGSKVVDRLAKDLRSEFPNMGGLSRTNLLYMRAFAETWPDESIVQQVVGQIPWGHNVRLLDLVKDSNERLWYVHAAIENGWSRNVLVLQIESGLYRRQGKAITNFQVNEHIAPFGIFCKKSGVFC